jgi:hypothetical protein
MNVLIWIYILVQMEYVLLETVLMWLWVMVNEGRERELKLLGSTVRNDDNCIIDVEWSFCKTSYYNVNYYSGRNGRCEIDVHLEYQMKIKILDVE